MYRHLKYKFYVSFLDIISKLFVIDLEPKDDYDLFDLIHLLI